MENNNILFQVFAAFFSIPVATLIWGIFRYFQTSEIEKKIREKGMEIDGKIAALKSSVEEDHSLLEDNFLTYRKSIYEKIDSLGEKFTQLKSSYDREVTLLKHTQDTVREQMKTMGLTMDKLDLKVDNMSRQVSESSLLHRENKGLLETILSKFPTK